MIITCICYSNIWSCFRGRPAKKAVDEASVLPPVVVATAVHAKAKKATKTAAKTYAKDVEKAAEAVSEVVNHTPSASRRSTRVITKSTWQEKKNEIDG